MLGLWDYGWFVGGLEFDWFGREKGGDYWDWCDGYLGCVEVGKVCEGGVCFLVDVFVGELVWLEGNGFWGMVSIVFWFCWGRFWIWVNSYKGK